jgi:hypothetical protein
MPICAARSEWPGVNSSASSCAAARSCVIFSLDFFDQPLNSFFSFSSTAGGYPRSDGKGWCQTPIRVKPNPCRVCAFLSTDLRCGLVDCFLRAGAATDMAGAANCGLLEHQRIHSREARQHNEGAHGGNRVSPVMRESGAERRFEASGAYRDRTGDLRLAKPVLSESAEAGSEGESGELAGDSEPPLPGATGSDRRESDRAVGQAWDEAGSVDDDPRSQRGPSDDSSTQPEVPGDEPSG